MIRLTAVLRRNPALTATEFHARWRDVHADVVRSAAGVADRIARYEQHPRLSAGPGRWTGSDGFDGVAVQWFRRREDFDAMLREPAYHDVVAPDERHLLDLDHSVYLLTGEPRLIIG